MLTGRCFNFGQRQASWFPPLSVFANLKAADWLYTYNEHISQNDKLFL